MLVCVENSSTARTLKVDILKNTYPDAHGKLEVVEMADLVSDAGKWPTILEGKTYFIFDFLYPKHRRMVQV